MHPDHQQKPTMERPRSYLPVLLLVLCLVVVFFLIFISNVQENRRNEETRQISEIASMCAGNIKDRLDIYTSLVKAAANQISATGGPNDPAAIKLLKQSVVETDFVSMAITFPDGRFLTTDEGKFPPPDTSLITDRIIIRTRTMAGADYISVIVPITQGRNVAATIRGLIPANRLKNLINQNIFRGQGYIHIIRSNGEFILRSNHRNAICRTTHSNIFDVLAKASFNSSLTQDDLKAAMKKGADISFSYAYMGRLRIAYFKPVGTEDWYVGIFVPGEYVASRIESIKKDAGRLVFRMSAILLLLIFYILYRERRSMLALKSANRMTEALIANIPGGVFKCKMDDRYTIEYLSSGFTKLTGCSDEEALDLYHRSFWNSISPQERENIRTEILSQIEEKDSFEVAYRMVGTDGNVTSVLNKGGRITEDKGIDSIYGVVVDITRTHKILEELSVSEERNKIAIKEANVLIFEYDAINDVLHNSDLIVDKFGVPPVIKDFMATAESSEDKTFISFFSHLASLTPENRTASASYDYHTPSDSFCHIEIHLTGIFSNDGGLVNVIGVIEDMTEQKDTEIKWLRTQKYKEILAKLHDRMFEFDITNDRIITGRGYLAGYAELSDSYSEIAEVFINTYVHPDDREKLSSIFSPKSIIEQYKKGEKDFDIEYRFLNYADNTYRWNTGHITIFIDQSDSALHMLWFVKDINEDKERINQLFAKATRDPLTGLFNRGYAEELIKAKMAEDSEKTPRPLNALMIIDLDNFKGVNDIMGHLFGDAILTDTARRIQETFRSTDITGRIGGDEFIVFMKDIPNSRIAVKKAKIICERLKNLHSGGSGKIPLTASIGLVFSPQDGDEFHDLYNKADIALYHAKNSGKACITVYDPDMGDSFAHNNNLADIDDINGTEGQFVDNPETHVFKILYEAKDMDIAIKSVMELIVRHFNFARGYIFENSPDNRYFSEVFEICNEGVEPTIQLLQNCSYETDRPDYHLNFDNDGIFLMDMETYTGNMHDLFKKQNITSLIQIALTENGSFRGFLGFDCCAGGKTLTEKEIRSVILSGQIIASFTLKELAKRKIIDRVRTIKEDLSRLDSCAYVVDADNNEILFANKKAEETMPDIKIGGDRLSNEFIAGGAGTMKKYVPEIGKWAEITVTPTEWLGRVNAYTVIFDVGAEQPKEE